MVKRSWLNGLALTLVLVLAVAGFSAWKTYAQGPDGDTTPCGQTYGPGMMHGSMMGGWNTPEDCPYADGTWNGRGMMGGGYGPEDCPLANDAWNGRGPARGRGMMGMMGGGYAGGDCPFADGMWSGGGFGMMNGPMMGYNNQFGMGMMGGWTPSADLAPAGETLTLDEAVAVAQAYVAAWEDPNLVLGEVMQFDNHFYAEVMESDSGRGAFEFLIDPASGSVVSEPGPNMMWNLRYGMHAGWGQTGSRWNAPASSDGVDMTVSAEAARTAAQAYLDANYPGLTADEEAEAFYGYYTLHILEKGQVVGMLSVNGATGDVWLHNWHGNFVTMITPES
jgi:hypothetical protein